MVNDAATGVVHVIEVADEIFERGLLLGGSFASSGIRISADVLSQAIASTANRSYLCKRLVLNVRRKFFLRRVFKRQREVQAAGFRSFSSLSGGARIRSPASSGYRSRWSRVRLYLRKLPDERLSLGGCVGWGFRFGFWSVIFLS